MNPRIKGILTFKFRTSLSPGEDEEEEEEEDEEEENPLTRGIRGQIT